MHKDNLPLLARFRQGPDPLRVDTEGLHALALRAVDVREGRGVENGIAGLAFHERREGRAVRYVHFGKVPARELEPLALEDGTSLRTEHAPVAQETDLRHQRSFVVQS